MRRSPRLIGPHHTPGASRAGDLATHTLYLETMIYLSTLLLGGALATAQAQTDQRSLLVTSAFPTGAPDCLRNAYYGAYGGDLASKDHVFLPTTSCAGTHVSLLEDVGAAVMDGMESLPGDGRYVWVGPAGVDHAVSGLDEMNIDEVITYIWESQAIALGYGHDAAKEIASQLAFGGSTDVESENGWGAVVIHASETSLVLYVSPQMLGRLDMILPPHLVPVALPISPVNSVAPNGWEPVPQHYLDHLANVTKHIKFDPKLDEILENELDVDNIRRNVRYLTGEGPSGLETRHSFTKGARKAAEWIKGKAESTGAKCHYHSFLPGFSDNVICEYPHAEGVEGKVILSAHYDSRGSFGSTRAPGADDDGSGSSHLLEVAAAIGNAGIRFHQPVVLAWFSGEEQGLYGSQYYATKLKKDNESVILNIQGDMLGYRAPGEPMQMALPQSIGTPQAAWLVGNLSSLYAPELVVGTTPGCCSDHQSFHAIGYPATAVFERNGPIADPMYHNSGDLSAREGYDFEQIRSIAKVTMASILTVAGWRVD